MYRTFAAGVMAVALVAPAYAEKPAFCNAKDLKPALREKYCIEPAKAEIPLVCTPDLMGQLTPEQWKTACKDVPIEDETALQRELLLSRLEGICKDYAAGKVGLPEEFRTNYCPDVPRTGGETEWALVRTSDIAKATQDAYKRGVRDCQMKEAAGDAAEALLDIVSELLK